MCVKFSSDDKYIASGSEDMTTKIWDFEQGKLIQTLYGHSHLVSNLCFSKNGKYLSTCSYDYTIKVWKKINISNKIIWVLFKEISEHETHLVT